MKNGYAKYGFLIGIAASVFLSLGGCAEPANRQGQIAMAKKDYEAGNYILAAHQLTTFIRNETFSRELGQAYYLRGLCYYQMGPAKHDAAMADFEFAMKKTRTAEVRGLCHTAIGHIYFEQRDNTMEQAAEHYEAALKDLPEGPPRNVVLYRLGECLQRLGRWEQADLPLSECMNRYSSSESAAKAKRIFGARTFRLQAGTFVDIAEAGRQMRILKEHQLDSHGSSDLEDGKPVYRIYVGQYGIYAAAREAMAGLSKIIPDAKIVATPLPMPEEKEGASHADSH
jgi:tetratricopeptide (TPR) repeat protein